MTPNAKPRNALASLLALSGSGLAVAAVATAYILQNYWGMQTQWVFLHTRTHRALILSAILVLLALLVKRFTRDRVARRGILLQMTSYLFLLLSATFAAQSILDIHKKLQFEPLPIEAKYKFSTDGVSANAPVWSKYLTEFAGKPAVHALEIGSYEGRSALWFLENVLTHDSATITCIDIFEEDFDATFDGNVKASGLGSKLTKLKGESRVALRSLKINFDFIYIDGSHVAKDVLVDAVLAWDLLKPGGVIIFDDYRMRRSPGDSQSDGLIPEPAIDAFLQVFRHYVDVIHRDYQVIVKKKPQPDFTSQGILDTLKSMPF
ncbi:MAG: class I SAM-dependent methyltransferase [Candidatus Binatia bacterium]